MAIRVTRQPQLSVVLEYGHFKQPNNRERSFMTNCIKELKRIGFTICYEMWQLEELKTHFNNLSYNLKNNTYYVSLEG